MTTYQLRLLLEGLAGVYSCEELSCGSAIVFRLMKTMEISLEEAEAMVEGAHSLKRFRSQYGRAKTEQQPYLQ